MTQTTTTILPMLVWIAGPGSGILSSILFAWMRGNMRQAPAIILTVLESPRYARWASFALAALLACLAAMAVAWMRSESIVSAVDVSLAAALSIIFSQLTHSLALPATVP